MEELLGLLIDSYQIEEIVGKGGMGVVYKAYDLHLERYIALKMLNTETINKTKFIEKFKTEAKNQAKLQHPHIVTVYGFIEYMNFLGIIMEYVEGECLDKIISRKGKLSLEDSTYIIKQVLYAIGYAHTKGFIHRDIKPSNIIISRDGIAKIMDFGISKPIYEKSFKKASGRVGTIYYMSPEQLKGLDAEVTSDIYSTGCTLFEMVTGQPPFSSGNEFELIDMHLKDPPPQISQKDKNIPQYFDRIIEKSLGKLPRERYKSADEFIGDLNLLEKKIRSKHILGDSVKGGSSKKIYTWITLFGIAIILLALLYFIFLQVQDLMTYKDPRDFKVNGIPALFAQDEADRNLPAAL